MADQCWLVLCFLLLSGAPTMGRAVAFLPLKCWLTVPHPRPVVSRAEGTAEYRRLGTSLGKLSLELCVCVCVVPKSFPLVDFP